MKIVSLFFVAASLACSGGSGRSDKAPTNPPAEQPGEGAPSTGNDDGKNQSTEANTLETSKGPVAATPEGQQLTAAIDDLVASSSDSSREKFKNSLFCFIGRQRAANGDAWYDRYNEIMDEDLATEDRLTAFEAAEAGLSGTILGDEDVENFEQYCPGGQAPAATVGAFSSLLSSPEVTPSFPRNCHPTPSHARRTAIIFFNGMFTDIGDAIRHKDNIKKAIEAAGLTAELAQGGEGLDYAVSYNQNENWYLQLHQVLSEKGFEQGVSIRKQLRRFWNGKETAEIKSARESYLSKLDVERYRNISDQAKQVWGIKSRLKLNHRLVFVSHSQGNFYSNFVFDSLDATERKSVRQVMVATPASSVSDGSTRYTTFANDLVMGAVRAAPGMIVLPAQDLRAETSLDWKGHGFSEVYLPHPEARARILNHIRAAAAETVYPDTQMTDGRLAATLKWDDSSKDFALHIFEGTRDLDNHIYWDIEAGIYGDLAGKVDDKPWDRYTTNCEATPPFQLTFAPQYYSGEGAGHATLAIEYGDGKVDVPVDIAEPTGASGSQDVESLVTVKVDVDHGTGKWTVQRLP